MDTALAYPVLRKVVLGAHGFVAGWMLLNGVAHSIAVVWKARAGTLAPHHDLASLLWVGAGLVAAGGLIAASWPALSRGSLVLPFASVGFFGMVIAAIATHYGFTFLGGSITLATVDLALLLANSRLNV